MFEFKEFGILTDGEIDLILIEKLPADISKGYVPAYLFQIALHGEMNEVGGIVLRIGMNDQLYYSGHIGFGIEERYRGHNYAAKSCLIVKNVALAHGLKKLWITCHPDNLPSRKTCEKCGATLIEILDIPLDQEMSELERQKCIYEWNL